MSRRQLRPGDDPLKPWSEDHPDYQRLREHDPVHAVTCPACAGAGGHAQPTGVQTICSLCGGVGKVVSTGMQDGQPTYRTAYFIAGPALQIREPLPSPSGRKRQRPFSFKVSYCFSPTFPGTVEDERFKRGAQLLYDLAKKQQSAAKGGGSGNEMPTVPAEMSSPPAQRQSRKRKAGVIASTDDDAILPCPS